MASRRTKSVEPKWMLVFVFFVAGGFMGGLLTYLYSNSTANLPAIKYHFPAGTYQYTNPTLISETAAGDVNTVDQSLELKIRGLISDAEKNGTISDAGRYYRDLEPGKYLAINSTMEFSAGYLLK